MEEDWRIRGQERHLQSAALSWDTYRPYRDDWEHDHCEFCFAKFSVMGGDFTAGYRTSDHYRWICEGCFADFKERFNWRVVPCVVDSKPGSEHP